MTSTDQSFDAIVIGTGFGGAVVACRLAQAGLEICVLERGRRYDSSDPVPGKEPQSDFPALPAPDRVLADTARWDWAKDQGLWDVRDLGDIQLVQGAGFGGGSLIYANVHLRAPAEVFERGWPQDYTAEKLAPYYDRVAGMLDVKPITAAPFSLIKTDQLEKAATALGRESDFFHPPLAVSFESGKNAFGKDQGACRACGECDTGCRYRAKNTLDLNYLAVVDALPNANVRTLAEVQMISELGERGADGYEVKYCDHLQGRETVRVRAKHVFVCAGAVNSTALLLACKREGECATRRGKRDRGLPRLDKQHGQLGQNYFLNADAFGIVYDARLPTPGAPPRLLQATMGPVITGAIVHRGDAKTWFLLQDGGFPKALARHVGLMRAPMMLRRNRFERTRAENRIRKIEVIGASTAAALPNPLPQPVKTPPIGNAGGIPGGPLTSQFDGLLRLAQGGNFARTQPKKIKDALEALRKELKRASMPEMTRIATETRDRLADAGAKAILGLVENPPRPLLRLLRSLLRCVFRKLAPSEAIAQTAQNVVEARLDEPLRFAGEVARFALGFDDHDHAHSEHAMVLLAMGRDDACASIHLDDCDVAVKLTVKSSASVYSQQERLMRDIAATLHGKLRVNPAWAFDRKPVTVHSQGGCRMSDDPKHGVTDAHGQVFDHEGLFVMDGGILPTSVGVNPSATIAAVAERNIEWFLSKQKCLPRPGWAELDRARIENWKKRAGDRRWVLTPPVGSGTAPVSQPVGVKFREKMSGYISEPKGKPIVEDDDDAYEAAEIHGRPVHPLSLTLTVRVRDIAQFQRDQRHLAEVQGKAVLSTHDPLGPEFKTKGTLEFFPDKGDGQGKLKYCLQLLEKNNTRVATLEGYKRVCHGPGADLWRDTTTLFVTLTPETRVVPIRNGALHVSMNRFMFNELPSFRVLGTDDPARIVWAMTAFNAFFFKSVQRVYAPQLNKVVDLFDDIGLR
jgi:choline dehydrogenase-like flavoprotein